MDGKVRMKAPPLALHFFIVCLANVAAVFYTPALPSMTQYFNISPGYAESSMYLYLLLVAIGCLIYGPISNRFGRKPALYTGFSIAILGSLFCIAAAWRHSFMFFDVGRMLQALGASAGLQVGFTIIGDCYRPPKNMQVTSYVSLAFAVGPSLGIALGGWLTNHLGWKSCFYFIALYLIVLLLLIIKYVPETLSMKHSDSLKIGKIIKNYYSKFKKLKVALTGLIVGCVVAFNYLFFSTAPFIGIEFLKLSPTTYGLYNLIPPIFLVVGCLLAAFLIKYLKPLATILIGLCVMAISVMVLFISFVCGYINTITLFFPFSVALIGQALVQINALGLIFHHTINKSLTSSVVMFINTMISTIIVFFLNFNKEQAPIILPTLFLVLGCLAFIFYFGLKRSYFHLIEH